MAPYKNAERIKQSSQEGFYKIHSLNENRRQPSKGNAQREQRRNARSTDIQCTGARILAPSLGRVTQYPWGSPHPPPARRRASPRSSAGTVLAVPRQADAGTAPLAVPPPGRVLGGCSSRPTGLSVPSSAAASGREGGDPSGLGGGGRGTRTRGDPPTSRCRLGPALTLQQSGDETVHVQLPVRHLVGSRRSFPAAGTRASRRRRLRRRLGVPSPTRHAAVRPGLRRPLFPGTLPPPPPLRVVERAPAEAHTRDK